MHLSLQQQPGIDAAAGATLAASCTETPDAVTAGASTSGDSPDASEPAEQRLGGPAGYDWADSLGHRGTYSSSTASDTIACNSPLVAAFAPADDDGGLVEPSQGRNSMKRERTRSCRPPTGEQPTQLQTLMEANTSSFQSLSIASSTCSGNRHLPVARLSRLVESAVQISDIHRYPSMDIEYVGPQVSSDSHVNRLLAEPWVPPGYQGPLNIRRDRPQWEWEKTRAEVSQASGPWQPGSAMSAAGVPMRSLQQEQQLVPAETTAEAAVFLPVKQSVATPPSAVAVLDSRGVPQEKDMTVMNLYPVVIYPGGNLCPPCPSRTEFRKLI
eukprot:GHUV01013946.1.p1 GENE.GHUV01013946.1~~GHUV01013946.1.p1  ORF type:complete len:327 (+),score=70.80 GHUV01013946.1:1480-2460(+)